MHKNRLGWEWIYLVDVPIRIGTMSSSAVRQSGRFTPTPRPSASTNQRLIAFWLGLLALILGLLHGNAEELRAAR